jgi:polysaccharide biosynthesis transport protein
MTGPYDMRFRDVIGILRRRRGFQRRALAVALGLGILISLLLPPVYRASATVTADKTPPVVLLDLPGFATGGVGAPFGVAAPDVPTLAALARSQTVREKAIANLTAATGTRAAPAILKHVRVQPLWNTELVRISVDHTDPRVAAEAANAVAASLADVDLQARRRWAKEMRRSIQDQLVVVDARLRAAEEILVASKGKFGDVPLTEKTVMSLDRLAQLEAQRVDVRLQRQEVRARIDTARGRLANQARVSPTQWVPSPLISTLETQLASQEIELSGLRRQFTPKHPSIVNVEAKITQTKRRLDSELGSSLRIDQYGVDPVYQQLVHQLRQDEVAWAALTAREQALASAIEQYEGRLRQLPSRELAQARLSRNAREAEDTHKVLTAKLQQALVAEASIGSVIRVVDSAEPPLIPMRPRWLILLVAASLGLVAGVGGALVKERIDDPIKSPEHVEHALGGLLGSIPQTDVPRQDPAYANLPILRSWRSSRAGPPVDPGGVVTAARRRAAFAESFRYLRTNLLCHHKRLPRTLLVTSPGTDEGTDIVAANLAIALAQAGVRVWLVDCDLRRPSLRGVPAFQDPQNGPSAGLAEWLDNEGPEHEPVRRTAIQNLSFLPAGAPPVNPAELLSGGRMRAFVQRDRDDVGVIVLAAPPVLPVTDAAVLAPAVEGVLLVVHVGTTPEEAAHKARQQLQAVGAHVLGVVATGVPIDGGGHYYDFCARYYGTEPSEVWYLGADRPRRPGAGPGISPMLAVQQVMRWWEGRRRGRTPGA